MNGQDKQHAEELVEQWRAGFASVTEAMGDFSPAMEVQLTPPVRGPGMLWWNQSLDLAPGAAIWIGAAEETWTILGRRILAAAGIDSAEPAELKDTYLEVLRQSLGVLATAVGARLDREVATTTGSEQEPGDDPEFSCRVTISAGDDKMPSLAFYLNREFLDAIPALKRPQIAAPKPPVQAAQDDSDQPSELNDRACGTLDLLLDVEMPVSVSFGRTQVRVQDILKLITGSIIELDRGIAEPVEVIVNNCTIARGEVVVLDGNYSVRIHEVMSRRGRLQESRKYLLPASTNRR